MKKLADISVFESLPVFNSFQITRGLAYFLCSGTNYEYCGTLDSRAIHDLSQKILLCANADINKDEREKCEKAGINPYHQCAMEIRDKAEEIADKMMNGKHTKYRAYLAKLPEEKRKEFHDDLVGWINIATGFITENSDGKVFKDWSYKKELDLPADYNEPIAGFPMSREMQEQLAYMTHAIADANSPDTFSRGLSYEERKEAEKELADMFVKTLDGQDNETIQAYFDEFQKKLPEIVDHFGNYSYSATRKDPHYRDDTRGLQEAIQEAKRQLYEKNGPSKSNDDDSDPFHRNTSTLSFSKPLSQQERFEQWKKTGKFPSSTATSQQSSGGLSFRKPQSTTEGGFGFRNPQQSNGGLSFGNPQSTTGGLSFKKPQSSQSSFGSSLFPAKSEQRPLQTHEEKWGQFTPQSQPSPFSESSQPTRPMTQAEKFAQLQRLHAQRNLNRNR